MPAADLAWAIEDVRCRIAPLKRYDDYYEGRHRLTFATEKFVTTFGDLFSEFADNMCDDVVDEPTGRLQLLNIQGPTKAVTQAAWDWWEGVKGSARMKVVHRNAFRDGDGYAIVWTDRKGRARLYPQCSDQMAVRYDEDEPDRIEVAAKVWRTRAKVWRANLYYELPDGTGVIERYATARATDSLPKAQAFRPYTEVAEYEGQAVQQAVERHPYGMIVFHFPTDEISRYGRSVLHDVISMQDALNKSVCDMLVNMEFVAYPQRHATGVQFERGPDGKAINPFESGANRIYWSANDNAQFGSFPQGDMTGFLDVQDSIKLEIARKGYLPPHTVVMRGSGAAPSGISLLVNEGRQVKRCKDAQDGWGSTWCELAAKAIWMDGGAQIEGSDLDLEWKEVSTRDEKALMETLILKQQLKVSDHQLLIEAGYDEDTIAEMEAEAEVKAQEAQANADAMASRMGGRDLATVSAMRGQLGLPAGPDGPAGAPAPALAG